MKEVNRKVVSEERTYNDDNEIFSYYRDEHGNYFPITRGQARRFDRQTDKELKYFIWSYVFLFLLPFIGIFFEDGWDGLVKFVTDICSIIAEFFSAMWTLIVGIKAVIDSIG